MKLFGFTMTGDQRDFMEALANKPDHIRYQVGEFGGMWIETLCTDGEWRRYPHPKAINPSLSNHPSTTEES